MIKVFTQPLGPVEANCYVVVKDHHALVIDPGDDFSALKRLLTEEEATLDAILLTHAHFDHIGGLDGLIEEYGVDVYMNPKEFDFLDDMRLNGSAYFYAKVKSHAVPKAVHDGMQKIGAFEVEAKTLPGHSVGSTIYRIEDALFTGDVLFQGSVGRVDLPTGSERDMMASIQYLKTLPQDLVVYPGHGPATTIGQELRWNPYFR
ncbi:MBL fold metallo-hydrolase [Dubosiella muris]|uniref:MBL fold metallo-hydrolase n=1 Tax=Dubosiella muris TaxID=3038133 RepID=A0AC61R7D8_9FIRM|nr:MBL fold metallo-hydrolase [Dubosiella muris]TGY66050.1 MBL fold metallo-hydrolase [Dubosiella muris]